MEHFIETVRRYPCLWNTTAAEYRDHELKDAAWTEVMKDTDTASVKEVKLKWKKLRDSYRDALKRQSDMMAKEPVAGQGGGGGKRNYPWKYMGLMQFLQPHMNARKKPAESPGSGCAPLAAPLDASPDTPHAARRNGDARSSSSSSSGDSTPRRRGSVRLAAIDRKLDYLCRATAAPAPTPATPAGKRPCLDSYYERESKRSPPPALPDPLDIFFNGMCQTTKRLPYQTQVKIKKLLFNAVTEAEEALIAEQQSYASLWARDADSSSGSEAGEAGEAAGGAAGPS